MTPPTLTLYTFAASQSSEKIRWALDASGLRYRESRLTPFLHYAQNLRISGSLGLSIPVLEADGQTVQDSTQILEWLEKNRAPCALIPREPQERQAAMQWEARFDHVGPHVVRCMYATLLEDPQLVRRLWTLDASAVDRGLLRAGFPLLSRIFSRGLGLHPALLEHSRRVIERTLNELDRITAAGRTYLVGERLTVADITAASRLAPLVCPDEHAVFSDPEYRDAIASLVSGWQARPSFAWLREMYRLHRRARPVRTLKSAPHAIEAFRRVRRRTQVARTATLTH